MYPPGIRQLIHAEREREIEANMQRRRQLRVEDAATEPSFPAPSLEQPRRWPSGSARPDLTGMATPDSRPMPAIRRSAP